MYKAIISIFVALVVAGCASLPPQAPINADSIAGTWAGIVYRPGGSDNVQVTINRDGTYTAKGPRGDSSGVYKIVDGRAEASNNTTGSVSTWKLYGDGAQRVLVSQSTSRQGQSFEVQLKPAR